MAGNSRARSSKVAARDHGHARVEGGALEDALRETIRRILREELAAMLPTRAVEYLTVREAAELAAVAEGTIRRWVREHRIAEHRAGRVVRVARADLEALLSTGLRHDARDAEADEVSPEELARRDFG